MQFAMGRAKALGVPEVRLYTNARMTRNLRIYAAAGFLETGRRPHPRIPGQQVVDMARRV